MSTTTTPFGAAEAQAARTLIGGTTLGDTRNELLKQILVATANKAGGSGGAAWGDITGTLSNQADLQAALDAKLSLAGGTMTGALVNSTNGAASTPALKFTGTPFSGGSSETTKPLFLLEPSGITSNNWNTGGTVWGVNAPSGFAGDLWSAQVNGVKYADLAVSGSLATLNIYGYGVNQRFYATDRTTVLGEFNGGRWFAQDFTTLNQIASFGNGDAVTLANQIPLLWSTGVNFYTGTPDIGLTRGGVGILKVTNGSSGYGTLDVVGLKASGTAGANFSGAVTSITVVNGIITAAS